MNLLHITATHLNEKGGIPIVLANLATAQNKITGFTAKVLAVKKGVSHIENPFFYYIHNLKEIEEFIVRCNPDIVIIHSVYYWEYYAISKILRTHKIRYLIEPHSAFCKAAQQKSYLKKYIANRTILKAFIKKADGYIYLNSEEKKKSIFHSVNDIIIPNGMFIMNKYIEKEALNGENMLNLYFIGRFDLVAKGIDILFDAIEILDKECTDIKIDFYGSGTFAEEKYIQKRILKIKNVAVRKMAPIYGDDKVEQLSAYNAMVLTSRYEGFPMTVLEALSYGNPCIVTDGTNVKDLIENNRLGVVTTYNPQDIAEKILKFKEEYFRFQKEYVERCRKVIVEQYNWDYIAQQSYDALQKLKNAKTI